MKYQDEVITASNKRKRDHSLPELLSVSPSPHIRKLDTVRSIMLDVIIALMPALIWGYFRFGARVLWIVGLSVATAVVCEAAYQIFAKKTLRITDLSCVVTGLMLGLMLPVKVSLWVPCIGSAFAILVVKQFFGGIGKNIVNPAIAARVFLMLCWPQELIKLTNGKTDVISCATPLVSLKNGQTPDSRYFDLVIGNCAGAIGEVSAIAIAIGFLYLLFRGVISLHIPVAFVGTIALVSVLSPITGQTNATVFQLLSGSLLFAAAFSVNDPTTTPVTNTGKIIFGIGCGLVTVFIRYFGAYPDGTAFAILLMNLLVPLFESWTMPKRFGGKYEKE